MPWIQYIQLCHALHVAHLINMYIQRSLELCMMIYNIEQFDYLNIALCWSMNMFQQKDVYLYLIFTWSKTLGTLPSATSPKFGQVNCNLFKCLFPKNAIIHGDVSQLTRECYQNVGDEVKKLEVMSEPPICAWKQLESRQEFGWNLRVERLNYTNTMTE